MKRALLLSCLAGCATTSPRPPAEEYRLAQAEGRWADAYVLAGEVTCSDPSLARVRELVQLWDRVGRPGEPEQNLVCELDPLTGTYLRAMSAAVRERFDVAAAALAEAAADAPRELSAELHYRRGVVLSLAERYGDAIAALDSASVADPRRVDIRLALANARLEALGPAPAIDTLEGILALSPTPRDVGRARELLNRSVSRAQPPMSGELRLEISSLLSQIEKDQVSPETAVRLRGRLGPEAHPRLRMVTGLVLMKLGRLAEGSHLLLRAAEESPLDPEPLRSLGTTLYTAGQVEMALPHLRDAAERDPFDVDTLKTLADASVAGEDIESAAHAYERLATLEPTNPEHYLWIARMERRRGDLPSARRAALRGCALVKSNIPLYLERASIEAQIALSTESSIERERATARTRDAVDALLDIAPGHPGAEPILQSLEAID